MSISNSNIINFNIVYSIQIKKLICSNEEKSFWFEHLLRTGNEIKLGKSLKQYYLPDPIPNNNLFKCFIDERLNQKYKSFLVISFFENVTVFQQAISNFTNEISKNIGLKNLFNNIKSSSEIYGSSMDTFSNILSNEYYYEYFLKYCSSPDIRNDLFFKQIMGVFILGNYIKKE